MDGKAILDVVMKHIDKEGMAKELASSLLFPEIDSLMAKIDSGEIDLVKGTSIDAVVMKGALELVKKYLQGV